MRSAAGVFICVEPANNEAPRWGFLLDGIPAERLNTSVEPGLFEFLVQPSIERVAGRFDSVTGVEEWILPGSRRTLAHRHAPILH